MTGELDSIYQDYRSAMEAGDVPRAVELGVRFAQADPPIDSLLSDFRAAITEGDHDKAESLLDKIGAKYESIRPEERAKVEKSVVVREQLPDTDARSTAHQHIQQALATQLSRSSFLTTSASYLADPEAGDSTEVTGQADTVEQREAELDDRSSSAESVHESTDLPPQIAIALARLADTTIPVGTTVSLTVEVRNIGDATATDVGVSASAPDGISVGNAEFVGDIEPDGSEQAELGITGTEVGQYSLTVQVESANAGSATDTVDVDVVEGGQDSPIKAIAGDDGRIDLQEVLTAIRLFNNSEPVPGSGGQTLTLDDVLKIIQYFNNDTPVQ